MKKFGTILAIIALALAPLVMRADTSTATITMTNGQAATYATFGQQPSGWLDRMEITQSEATATNTIVIATRAANGTTAVDTFGTFTGLVGNKVARPRLIGTTTAGVNLAATVNAVGTESNTTTQILSAPYERPLIGGNLRVSATEATGGNPAATTNTITVILYFEPLPR